MADDVTFALDIGTRTLVGLILKEEDNKYKILHSAVREHKTRAMLDGQIHNVEKVAEEAQQIKKELEEKSGLTLNKAAIAAAGRSLKTIIQKNSIELEKNRYIEKEDIKELELRTIKQAEAELAYEAEDDVKTNYHFVGYTVRNYKLDGMEIGNLLGQRGHNMEVELVATFLPRIVIDSLLSVIERIGIEVEHLTLEPIAAHNIVIPESMDSFNLALVDIGAGTSDIAVTENGSISGYEMVPTAGDEITEVISEKFLIDYKSAEKIKCSLNDEELPKVKSILGEELALNRVEVLESVENVIEEISTQIAEQILKINNKAPQAVIFIGGGSLIPGLKEKFSQKIEMVESRVGIRKKDDLENIDGEIEGISSTQTLTPIGIAVITRETENKALFINVEVNGEIVNLLTFSKADVSEALLAADIELARINPRPGRGITATVNGQLKVVRGELGEAAHIEVNGKEAALDTALKAGDSITFKPGKKGKDAEALIKDIIAKEDLVDYEININGSTNHVKTQIYQNNKLVQPEDKVIDGADIEYEVPVLIRDGLAQIMGISVSDFKENKIQFTFNGKEEEVSAQEYRIYSEGEKIDLSNSLRDNLNIEIEEVGEKKITLRYFLQEQRGREITFNFNGSELKLPASEWLLKANGEEVGLDYKISADDEIIAEAGDLTVEAVCRYINYDLTDKLKERMKVELNGKEADFSALVNDGDKLFFKLTG